LIAKVRKWHDSMYAAINAMWRWYLSSGPSVDGPHDALLGIANVAVVVWTGGFVLRAWRVKATLPLMFGMDLLQIAFTGAIIVLLAPAVWLRSFALVFLIVYSTNAFSKVRLVKKREVIDPNLNWIANEIDRIGINNYYLMQAVLLSTYFIAFLMPNRGTVAWVLTADLFIGFQVLLRYMYAYEA